MCNTIQGWVTKYIVSYCLQNEEKELENQLYYIYSSLVIAMIFIICQRLEINN